MIARFSQIITWMYVHDRINTIRRGNEIIRLQHEWYLTCPCTFAKWIREMEEDVIPGEPRISGADPDFTRDELAFLIKRVDGWIEGLTDEQIVERQAFCRKACQKIRVVESRFHIAFELRKERLSKEEQERLKKLSRSYRPKAVLETVTSSKAPRRSKEEKTLESLSKLTGKSIEELKASMSKFGEKA